MNHHENEADAKGATEDQVEKIDTIDSQDALGDVNLPSEEHSGQKHGRKPRPPEETLADNEPDEVPEKQE